MFRLNRAFDHFRPAFAHHFAFVNLIPPRIEPSRVYVTSPPLISRTFQYPIFQDPSIHGNQGSFSPSNDSRANSSIRIFSYSVAKFHRLTDFRGKRPPLFQEFERYNSSSPTWRPSLSRSCMRVHAHTHARTHVDVARARHVETRHRFSND